MTTSTGFQSSELKEQDGHSSAWVARAVYVRVIDGIDLPFFVSIVGLGTDYQRLGVQIARDL